MPEQNVVVPDATEAEIPKVEVPEPAIEPEDKSPYQAELDRIEADKKAIEAKHKQELDDIETKRREQMAFKDKALEKAKKDSEPFKNDLKREMKDEILRELDLREARSILKDQSQDMTEQKVVLHHYENLPDSLRTGDVEEDLLTARALALKKRIPEMLNQQNMDAENERKSIASMGGGNLPGRSSFQKSSSAAARTASLLTQAYAKGKPELAKKLTERNNARLR